MRDLQNAFPLKMIQYPFYVDQFATLNLLQQTGPSDQSEYSRLAERKDLERLNLWKEIR